MNTYLRHNDLEKLAMTVSYNLDVSSSRAWTFMRVVFRWDGSIWKNCLGELFLWVVGYYLMFAGLRLFDLSDKLHLWELAVTFDKQLDWIPLQFMLGFFVTIVVDRWKQVFANFGFVDNLALRVANYVDGDDNETIIIRRNIVRYACLAQVMALRDIAIPVRKRFPNMDAVVDAGFMNKEERRLFDDTPGEFARYWLPIHWAYQLTRQLRRQGRISCDLFCHNLCEELKQFREHLQRVTNYDWVPVPLAYTQVVFMAVRVYFLICLFSRQYTTKPDMSNDWYVIVQNVFPVMSALQFFFCMGWLKVAEALLNPLGEDDDDFEANFVIDRNLSVGLSIVDCRNRLPSQVGDAFGKDELALDVSSGRVDLHHMIGSASQMAAGEGAGGRKRSVVDFSQSFADLKCRMSRRKSQKCSIQPVTPDDIEKCQNFCLEQPVNRQSVTSGKHTISSVTEEDRLSSSSDDTTRSAHTDEYRSDAHKGVTDSTN